MLDDDIYRIGPRLRDPQTALPLAVVAADHFFLEPEVFLASAEHLGAVRRDFKLQPAPGVQPQATVQGICITMRQNLVPNLVTAALSLFFDRCFAAPGAPCLFLRVFTTIPVSSLVVNDASLDLFDTHECPVMQIFCKTVQLIIPP
jgi:hypothetical protein